MKNELLIAISGQVSRENSANLMNFWKGFINIQNSIYNIDDLKIIAHSWNPEFDDIVKNVYNIDTLISEKQENFFREYIDNIESIDFFEKGLNRANSKWQRISYQSLLGNARSRSKIMSILDDEKYKTYSQVLATRWDQGCSGSKDVNIINYDQSLNSDYFYISYYDEVDEGYADMWFLAPLSDARLFKDYDKYLLESLGNKNNYINNFTQSGWPLSFPRKRNKFRKEKFILKILNGLQFVKFPFLSQKINKYEDKLQIKIDMPIITGENYLLRESSSNVKFPTYKALNNHAILKSFILDKQLREKVRFIKRDDFQKNNPGQMINPKSFAHAIYSHSSYSDCWEMAIGQSVECLPSNCKKVYLISDDSIETEKAFERIKEIYPNIVLIVYDNNANYTKRLQSSFSEIKKEFDYLYFIHEDMPLIEKVDDVYLNSLLHYLDVSNEFYIKLVDTTTVNKKEEHDSFPDLKINYGECSMSVQASIFDLDYMISLFDNLDMGLYEFELAITRSNLIFSAIKGEKKVGKSVLMNYKFPHITTAIAKGKWCTSEWGEEIRYLAKKYHIDLSERGER